MAAFTGTKATTTSNTSLTCSTIITSQNMADQCCTCSKHSKTLAYLYTCIEILTVRVFSLQNQVNKELLAVCSQTCQKSRNSAEKASAEYCVNLYIWIYCWCMLLLVMYYNKHIGRAVTTDRSRHTTALYSHRNVVWVNNCGHALVKWDGLSILKGHFVRLFYFETESARLKFLAGEFSFNTRTVAVLQNEFCVNWLRVLNATFTFKRNICHGLCLS